MKKCKFCDAAIEDDGQFCTECGKSQRDDSLAETADQDSVDGANTPSDKALSPAKASITDDKKADTADSDTKASSKEEAADTATDISEDEASPEADTADSDAKTSSKEESADTATDISEDEASPEAEAAARDLGDAATDETGSSADEEKGEHWVAPPDPFEIRKRKHKKIITLLVAVALVVVLILSGVLFFKNKGSKPSKIAVAERPLIYVNSVDKLMIKTSVIDVPIELGNQGFKRDSQLPALLSNDNLTVAYLTEEGSLFVVPVGESTSGVIDAKYHADDNVAQLLAFGSDNNKLVYYTDQDGALKSFNGSAPTTISEKFVAPVPTYGLETLFVFDGNRAVYLESASEATPEQELQPTNFNLCTIIAGKPNTQQVIDTAFVAIAGEPTEPGVFYFTPIDNGDQADAAAASGQMKFDLKYYDFSGKGNHTIAESKNFYTSIWLKNQSHALILETITADSYQAGETTVTFADGVPKFRVVLYNNGAPTVITENILGEIYPSESKNFLIYKKAKEGGLVDYYHRTIGKDGSGVETLLLSATEDKQFRITQAPDGKSFLTSIVNDDGATVSIRMHEISSKGKLKKQRLVDELAINLLPNTVAGNYIIQKNLGQPIEGTTSCDLYMLKTRKYEVFATGVDVFSVGRTLGTEPHDDVILYVNSMVKEGELLYSTLNIFNGKTVRALVNNFPLPSQDSIMPLMYDNPDLVYYFIQTAPASEGEQGQLSVYEYTTSGGNKLVDSNILGLL